MPKPSIRAEVNNFVGGLVTEASPLNFPANASLGEENFELKREGTRERRFGMNYEPGYNSGGVSFGPSPDFTNISSFIWKNVNGDANISFVIAQIGNSLRFYNYYAPALSAALQGSLALTPFSSQVIFSFAAIEGKLVVVGGSDSVAIVSYDSGSNTFTSEYDKILVRDAWGVESIADPLYETDVTYRGNIPDTLHRYNLQNQSWGITRKNDVGTIVDPIVAYQTAYTKYPSNSESVWTGIQFQATAIGTPPSERLFTGMFEEVIGGDSKAAKGYYIIDLLSRGFSRLQKYNENAVKYPGLSATLIFPPPDITNGGPSIVTEFAGRVFYAGFNGDLVSGDNRSPNLSNYVLFSQLVRNRKDFIKCYQEGDPTSRENSDLVDTDGGFIRISGAGTILALIDLESALIVIANNGVWQISGGSDFGFSATNYKVSKISSFGGLAKSSVVVEGGRAFFWSADGIYAIGKDQVGAFGVINITEKTIQTLYDNIPSASKPSAVGAYDPIRKKIKWTYTSGTRFTSTSETKELILDTVLNVFYQHSIKKTTAVGSEVVGVVSVDPFRSPVSNGREDDLQTLKYLTLIKIGAGYFLTFSQYWDTEFTDWKSEDGVGVDAKAYLLTGQQTAKDSAVAKQIPYLIMYFIRTEKGVTEDLVPALQSGCFVRGQWDFANTIVSNKWSSLTQAYRYKRAMYVTGLSDTYDNGFELVVSKSKLRGRGKAFSLYMETEPKKDCRIVGWSISLNGNTIA